MSNAKHDMSIIWKCLFSPDSIAVIGASNTKGSWGYSIMQGLLDTGERRIYPINPKAGEVFGLKAYRSVVDIPDPVDLAVIVIAAPFVSAVLNECASKRIKTAVIITAGFAELGEEGQKLEAELVKIASEKGIRFLGPNSLGHANTLLQLSTFGQKWKMPTGPVALLSQSGNMCLNIVRAGNNSGIAFSKYVSSGNEANLHLEDYLEYLAEDDDTKIIAAYIEGLREGRRFFQLAKRISIKKPMVVIKTGGTEESARAVRSHTGALAGSDSVYTAAFKQAGVMRVSDDEELCDVLFALLNSPLPCGNRIGILSMGGGPGALTAEACEKEGLVINQLDSSTVTKLDTYLPSRWSRRNPVDMAGISAAEYPVVASSLWALIEDRNIDVVFLQAPILATKDQLTHRMGLNEEEMKAYRKKEKENLRLLRQKMHESGKPVIFVGQFGGIRSDPEIASLFSTEKILAYPNARRAARVMRHLAWYKQYLNIVNG
jgi:acyl-CoA synthetase (NDP forming)